MPGLLAALYSLSSITISMDRYGHLYEGHDTEVASRLEKTYRKALRAGR